MIHPLYNPKHIILFEKIGVLFQVEKVSSYIKKKAHHCKTFINLKLKSDRISTSVGMKDFRKL